MNKKKKETELFARRRESTIVVIRGCAEEKAHPSRVMKRGKLMNNHPSSTRERVYEKRRLKIGRTKFNLRTPPLFDADLRCKMKNVLTRRRSKLVSPHSKLIYADRRINIADLIPALLWELHARATDIDCGEIRETISRSQPEKTVRNCASFFIRRKSITRL